MFTTRMLQASALYFCERFVEALEAYETCLYLGSDKREKVLEYVALTKGACAMSKFVATLRYCTSQSA